MTCPACQSENRDSAKFCGACRRPLAATLDCPACGTQNPSSQRFCDQCGEALGVPTPAAAVQHSPRAYTPKHLADKILASKSALEGERKQVTVLFADVRGSMELAESIDPEEWHRILDRFFGVLADGVHRFEGTVNQYTGDGIMALFGAPITHEDHAQRACYAALSLRDALRELSREVKRQHGLDLATRIGINSGEVVVGKIGDDLRMDYTAQGHTVGLAQRMESLASVGSVYLSDRTAAIVSGYFALEDLGEFRVKGASDPVRVFELAGVGALRTRFDRSRARGLSKFVGRAQEMQTLEAALEQALAGHGRVVGVVAEAGTGKSRLCFEFAEACRAKRITVRATTGVAHGKAVPLLPVLELYRGTFGITERDDARAARQKIAGGVVQNDESLVASLPLLFDFLGVPDPEKPVTLEPGPDRQRALLGVLKRLTLARSRREPAVIVFEDLHWIDDATGVFLENLVDAADASRTLLVVNFRPEYRADWMRRSYYQQLALAPLDAGAFAEMLGETLGNDASVRALVGRIHQRSGGNPFFAEEIVQTLVESGALAGAPGAYKFERDLASFEIPATVQLVLAARIDRLGEREKSVLQTASVIGREFSESLLRRVAGVEGGALGDALRALVQAEFLHETALYPEAEYAFKHPLTQEVALGSQLRERRARVHAAVAEALIETRAGTLDEHAALLAHHFEAAGDPARAARWHERAADWLEPREPHAARRHWERLLELAGPEPETPEQARSGLRACARLLMLGALLGLELERGERLHRRGRELLVRVDDANLEAGLLGAYLRLLNTTSGNVRAEAAEQALRLAPRVTDPSASADLLVPAALALMFQGRGREALVTLDAALSGGRVSASTPIPLGRFLGSRGRILGELGRLDDARADLDRAAELLADKGDVLAILTVDIAEAFERRYRGFPAGSLEWIARSVARADDAGAHFFRVQLRSTLVDALLFASDPRAALETIESAVAIANENRASLSLVFGLETQRVRALLALGRVEAATELALDLVANPIPGAVWNRARSLLRLAEVLIASDAAKERARIEASLSEVAEIAERSGSAWISVEVHVDRAGLARALGDEAGRERELREALRINTAMNATGWMERIAKELAE